MPRSAPMTTARGVNSSSVALSGTKGRCERAGTPFILFLPFGCGAAEPGRRWRVLSHVRPGNKSARKPSLPPPPYIYNGARPMTPSILPERAMRLSRIPVFAAVLAELACSPLRAAEPARPVPPRFSAAYIDKSADPRADFARYAFGAWQKMNPVPPDKARWGSFNELEQYNQLALKGILEAAAARTQKPGSVEQEVGDFFKSAMDTAAVDAAGLKPVEADLARVAAIASTPELERALATLHDRGVDGFFRVFVRADQKRSEINALYAYQGGMSLPSKAYYFDAPFEKFRAAFVEHVAKMLALAGDSPEAAAVGAQTVFEVEKALAADAKAPAELRDAIANYNKMPTADLAGKLPVFPMARYF